MLKCLPLTVMGSESDDVPIVFATLQVKVLPSMSYSGWFIVSTFR